MQFEIKLNVAAAQVERALAVFGLDPGAGKDRRIWFGEVLDGRDGPAALPLLARGVILRVRAKKNGGDVTLKLRGPDGCVDAGAWAARTAGRDAKIEGDWASRRLVSASLDADLDDTGRAALDTDHPTVDAVLSDAQRALAHDLLVPTVGVPLLGPVRARRWDPDGDVAAELWTVDDLRFLEISVVATEDPEKAQHELLRRALDGGVTPDDDGDPKTTRVLRHLATRAGGG